MTTLPGWPLTVTGLPLPEQISLREDEDLVYLCRNGQPVAALTKNAIRESIMLAAVLLASETRHVPP